MAKKKAAKQYTRKVGKIGSRSNHSYYVTLPIAYIRNLGWREGQKVIVKRVGTKLHIADWES